MKCDICQADMKRSVATFHVDRKGYHLTLDAVPAWVCPQCGETYFEQPEVESIQRAALAIDHEMHTFAELA
ncbi:MAG TPA: type II toxin-antitoxin system MqsA family antitoxin [Candidatus Kapabacteria bacterium]|nr:type II toxin-antitoxin system MqsA family antitoxin [Candidatus Kapabacteria bacterium]